MDNFHKTELSRALSEVQYGILAYRIDDEACNDHVAVALMDLLEQRQIRVELSNRGYEVLANADNGAEAQTFEMLENLLSHFSPLFRARQADELMTRLLGLKDGPD